ncbi:type III-A CRISPR-associated RAMP protein Csm4 [Geitlerinema sp. P-1104]|uniref:type III-A CRISPR-associated RAMP protein Csm4 n=1 Tax=Geitlerinema sp. P-1104 TaxID=2546230 RepID=UPI0014775994|nr:type III-A CRISPR-associated RAMP protein Csm4 [Geitlerinema sp. P-1104]NMG57323.1 type III-A CRISPR-associated RAMP protein Csm4 [Geitlerinema sp. P-1104]
MSDRRLVKLNFGNNPVHFGEVGIGIEETSERLSSDGLFSAWISLYARLWGAEAVEQLLGEFHNSSSPPFRLSSTFVYRQQDQSDIFYLPKPRHHPHHYPDDDLAFFKTYKKLHYLPVKIWRRWYQEEGFSKQDQEELIAETQNTNFNQNFLRQSGVFDYKKSAFQEHKLPQVAIDRRTAATNLYKTGFVQFVNQEKQQAGLYCLIEFPQRNPELEQSLQAALQLLSEEGLGGRRSRGAGRFEFDWTTLPPQLEQLFNPPQPSSHHCLLSLYWDDIPWDDSRLRESYYELRERRGWLSGSPSGMNLRRKSVTMFLEGSLFKYKPQGKLAEVTPSEFNRYRAKHPVYRSGVALSCPVRVKELSEVQS